MNEEEEKVVPALYHHCEMVYNTMLDSATKVTFDDGSKGMVYEGFLTALVDSLNLSRPYYTFTKNALIEMGCIRQLRRGGSTSPSEWELVTAPTQELFLEKVPTKERPKYATVIQLDMYEQRIGDLTRRVRTLEKALGI